MTAVISEDGMYRYRLTRSWGDGRHALFVMLNPSTADDRTNDMTIRKCMRIAREQRCDGIVVVNLFAYRATRPGQLLGVADPVGPDNPCHLDFAMNHDPLVGGGPTICAWGGSVPAGLTRPVLASLAPLWCLGLTAGGEPRHPSRLARNIELIPYHHHHEGARHDHHHPAAGPPGPRL